MKRIIITMSILIALIFSSSYVVAEGSNSSTEIKEEQTPEAARRKQKDYTMYYATFTLAIIAGGIIYLNKRDRFKLMLDGVESNGDGSYTVFIGYDNNTNKNIKFNEDESGFKILKGNAILLKNSNPLEYEKGTHRNSMIVVINDESEVEFYAGDQKIVVKGKDMKKRS